MRVMGVFGYRRRGVVVVFFLLAFSLVGLAAEWPDSTMHNTRGEYLLRFAREVRWPGWEQQNNFYIEIVGRQSAFTNAFVRFCARERVDGKPINITVTSHWSQRSSFHRPHMVYVTASAMTDLPQIYQFFTGFPVLVVSERPYYRDGWMVSFQREEGLEAEYKQHPDDLCEWTFRLNAYNIERESGLVISPSLMRYDVGDVAVANQKPPVASPSLVEARGKAPASMDVVELMGLLSERDRQLAHRDVTIRHQQDTIISQRRVIDWLSIENLALAGLDGTGGLKRQGNGWLYLVRPEEVMQAVEERSPVALNGARDALQADAYPSFIREKWVLRTAPWKDDVDGFIVLLSMGLVCLASVLVTVFVFPGGAAGETVGRAVASLPGVALMGGAVAEHEEKKRAKEQEALHEYNQQLEQQLVRNVATLDALRMRAQRSEQLKQGFLANVSHEIRTPLNAIVGLSQYVASSPVVDDDVKESLAIINESAFGLIRVMNNIMTLAMLEHGEIALEESEYDLGVLFEELFTMTTNQLRKLGHETTVSVYYSKPAGIADKYYCDGEKVQTILDSLLSRALVEVDRGSIHFGCALVGDVGGSLRFFVRQEQLGSLDADVDDSGTREALRQKLAEGLDIAMDVSSGLAKLMSSALVISEPREGVREASFTLAGRGL